MFNQGIALTAFEVDVLEDEVMRLKQRGVQFTMDPTDAGPVKIVVFSDTTISIPGFYRRLEAAEASEQLALRSLLPPVK